MAGLSLKLRISLSLSKLLIPGWWVGGWVMFEIKDQLKLKLEQINIYDAIFQVTN